MMRKTFTACLALSIGLLFCYPSCGQTLAASTATTGKNESFSNPAVAATNTVETGGFFLPAKNKRYPLHIQHADNMIYREHEGYVHGDGNVVMTYGEDTLIADEVNYSTVDKIFKAKGHVVYHFQPKPGEPFKTMRCDAVEYEMNTEKGFVHKAKSFLAPVYVDAPLVEQIDSKKQIVREGEYTTCNLEKPHYYLKAQRLLIYPNDRIVAKNVVMYVGTMPVFYWPSYTRKMDDNESHYKMEIGSSSRLGYYVRTLFKLQGTDNIKIYPRLDYYSKQGFGIGADLKYNYDSAGHGLLQTYYIDERDADIERYRLSYRHRTELDNNIRISAYADYPSDSRVDEDFMRMGQRGDIETRDMFLSVDKWDNDYNIRLIARRIDEWISDASQKDEGDFKLNEESAPKLEASLKYQKLGDAPFYYTAYGSVGEYKHYEGLTPVIHDTTYQSLGADFDQSLSWSQPLSDKDALLATLSLYNSYSEKTSEDAKSDDYDLYLQGRLRWQHRFTPYLKSDVFYTAQQQLDNSGEDTPSGLMQHSIGSWINYRMPGEKMRIRWRGEYSLLPDDDIQVDSRQYYSRMEWKWKFADKWSTDLTNVLAKGKQESTAAGEYFHQYQSFLHGITYTPNNRWQTRLVTYYKLHQTPEAAGGDYDELSFYPSYTTYLGKKWKVNLSANYNATDGKMDETKLELVRDLHCWEAYIRLTHTPDNDSIHFILKIKAFTDPIFAMDDRNPLED
jgi:lipopolysaccharide assembly outer membrane protein LptD (OstA)